MLFTEKMYFKAQPYSKCKLCFLKVNLPINEFE